MRRLLILAGVVCAGMAVAVPVALSSDGATQITRVLRGARLPATVTQEQVDVARSPDFATRKPQSRKTVFKRGVGPQNTVAADTAQVVELHCPARFTAISGGFLADNPAVVLSTMSFDPRSRTGMIIRVSDLASAGTTNWFAEVACER